MIRRRLIARVMLLGLFACTKAAPRESAFAGSGSCQDCHAAEFANWRTSQHAAAMRRATGNAVLGDFKGSQLRWGGARWTFARSAARYVVTTQASDGVTRDFRVAYTFGVWPLQQYLVEYAGGRLQALSVAWDARPASQGGQRWFSLSPAQVIEHGTAQHWTGRGYNWNYMCADCHSTGVRKGYDAVSDTFHTTRAGLSVECEACHGPAAEHVRWAEYPKLIRGLVRDGNGLVTNLNERRGIEWRVQPGARIAARSQPRATEREIETCAQCHARRVHIAEGYTAGKPLFDYYIPSLVTSDLYYPDGQQREEVYTYGSFVQSRMYAAGVTCSDCHDPHTGKTRKAGNQLCTQCHVAATYDTSAHHFHPAGSTGSACVSCHMPDTTYMQIDPRHDHSLRVPRPDLSVTLGVPNACSRCHTDRAAAWAAERVAAWYPTPVAGHQRFAFAFAADDAGDPRARDSLMAVARDATQSAMARGSALARLHSYADSATTRLAAAAVGDPSPLVRLGALQALESAPAELRVKPAAPLLRDARRAVRQGAAWVLAPFARQLPESDREAFTRAAAEFVGSQRYNADQPDDRLALGAFYAQLGRLDSAAVEYRAALRLEPRLSRASVFLAALLRAQGRMADALIVLDSARARVPGDKDVLLSLATYRAESGDTAAAVSAARALVQRFPGDGRGRELLRALAR
jgi:predicted CXXCH cytochrome family protein